MGAALHTPVTNEDLMVVMQGMMQMTSDGFVRLEGRMDRLEARVDAIERRLEEHDLKFADLFDQLSQLNLRVTELGRIVHELVVRVDRLENHHAAYMNDIKDLLDQVSSLEQQMHFVTHDQLPEIQHTLQELAEWALRTAKAVRTT